MQPTSLWLARRRVALASPLVGMLTFIAQPAAAAGDPNADVNSANQNLHNAQAQAQGADAALRNAQAQLAAATAQLADLGQRITGLDAAIAGDTASLNTLRLQLDADRAHLATYLRQAYENGGSEADLVYIISAGDIATAIQRKVQVDHVATAAQQLVDRINDDTKRAAATLAQDDAARQQLTVAEQQAQTTRALIAVQEEQVQMADVAAHDAVQQAQTQLSAAEAALAAARAAGTVYLPVAGAVFTEDTDLTQPSGETAARINSFLQGTALAGLGDSFMHAEQQFHVSARYFVAHAILESDWGTSAIAQDKHNLFGFNADDANPYGDATSFPSFDACIQAVARFVATNYLSSSGPFYHGPTLRGMNVDYASDPGWAAKIASIARTIP
ncbi:MAG: glucosaminidase domain-containing protein [Candidatus Dormibacteraeota bacterium]|nr:glucosaminidase domain-containing protein [Candidatus Dormibacteraeota bacterium]MBV9524358.1 glucosaminidase domain-containing protein [Candidatus Dormibacteraeota bacterium]